VRKAVIFDLDGVLIDSLDAHFAAWTEFWRRRGKRHTRKMFDDIVATATEETLKLRNRTFGTNIPIRQGVLEREKIFHHYLHKVRPYPGAHELLKALSADYRIALATSTGRKLTRYLLNKFKLTRYFDAVVTKNDVTRSKPDPAIYRLAARKLGVRPRDAVVIEDAPIGILAAKRAGMKVIAVEQTFPRRKLAKADVVVRSIRDVRLREAGDA